MISKQRIQVFKDAFVCLQEKLIPGIYLHWKIYQDGLIEKLKNHGEIVIAGDGRHDSMGHSAKYCAYTVFCCTLPFIIHFAIVQVCQEFGKYNEVKQLTLHTKRIFNFPVLLIILIQ